MLYRLERLIELRYMRLSLDFQTLIKRCLIVGTPAESLVVQLMSLLEIAPAMNSMSFLYRTF